MISDKVENLGIGVWLWWRHFTYGTKAEDNMESHLRGRVRGYHWYIDWRVSLAQTLAGADAMHLNV